MQRPPTLACRRCRFPGADVRLQGCGCYVHTRCLPLTLVFSPNGNTGQSQFGPFPPVNTATHTQCPMCMGAVTGIVMEPLRFDDVERAVQLRREANNNANNNNNGSGSSSPTTSVSDSNNQQSQPTKQQGKKHSRDEDPHVQAESSYLLLASSSRSSVSNSCLSREQQRTGRWTNEEIKFVDRLVAGFDNGSLPLPHGIKLNEFLGDMLLCKSSRLTKKMKNAKLSSRSFELNVTASMCLTPSDIEMLSTLQEKFLSSVPSESSKLELRFNLEKQWRTHLYNLCVQVGYSNLDAKDWLASAEELEQRANTAEDNLRRVRRRRMGMALQTDGGSAANPSVYIAGFKADDVVSQLPPTIEQTDPTPPPETTTSSGVTAMADEKVRTVSNSDEGRNNNSLRGEDFSELDVLFNESGISLSPKVPRGRSRTLSNLDLMGGSLRSRGLSDDFDAVLDTLMDEEDNNNNGDVGAAGSSNVPATTLAGGQESRSLSPHACGPFLDAIIHHMEVHNLPFQHADIWVPSFSPRDGTLGTSSMAVDTNQLRLYHAGHASRGDLSQEMAYKLHEFGVYSDNFSFEPGHGLPGRVYATGQISWEAGVQEKDPKVFERAGGAKVYGVKTAVGIPLDTPLVGRIVVGIYSSNIVSENIAMAQQCSTELLKYSPEPKWKLVLETGPNNQQADLATTTDVFDQYAPADMSDPKFGLASPIMYSSQPTFQPPSTLPSITPAWNETNAPPVTPKPDQNDEKDLISLLGQNMPVADGSPGGGAVTGVLADFMSLRLLLLRAAKKRSAQENELIEILKSSYKSYAKDGRRDSKDLANLIVKDWVCLKATYGLISPASSAQSPPGPLAQPMSHPVARRLSSMEPPQRRPSAGSLKPAFQAINHFQPMQQKQVIQPMNNSSTTMGNHQYQPNLATNGGAQRPPLGAPQMTHYNYRSPLVNPQMPTTSDSGIAMQSPSATVSISSSTHSGSSNSLSQLHPSPFISQAMQPFPAKPSDAMSKQ